jgi:predicted transcriptional regulator
MNDELIDELDALARKRGTSRNRLIVEACEQLLEQDLGEWTADFFSNDHLSGEELEELREDAAEMVEAILAARRSRVESSL